VYYLSDKSGITKVSRIRVDEETGQTLTRSEEVASGVGETVWHLESNRSGSILAVESIKQNNTLVELNRLGSSWSEATTIPTARRHFERPDWSPDGRHILVMSGGISEGLFLVDPDTGDAVTILDEGFRTRSPRWSPIGEQLAFYSNRDGAYGVWVSNRDGTSLRKVSPEGSYRKPLWLKDGRRMVVHSDDNLSWLLDTEDKSLELLSARMITWHALSADGTELAGWDANGVYLMDIASQEVRTVFEKPALPLFAVDSQHLLLAQADEVLELDLATLEIEEVLRVNGQSISGFSVSADGERLVLVLSQIEGSVWRLVDSNVHL
jgi:Tol biopolymer transport system component